jgi:predicted nuclease of predicted toxin-antitoxin system
VARLYSDENFPFPVVEILRQLGHDVLTIQQTGKSGEGVEDSEVFAAAIVERRAVVTLNRSDFKRLHRTNQQHHGVIICTVDGDFQRQAQRIHDAIKDLASLDGQLIRVYRPDL